MKKLTLLITLISLIFVSNINAQDCFKYFPSKKGTSLEYTSYDKGGKATSTSVRTITDNKTIGDSTIVDFKVETTPVDKDTTIINEYQVSCASGKLYVNAASGLSSDMYSAYEGMDIVVDGSNMELPNNPSVGQVLNDANATVKINNNGATMLTITSVITNRKIESIEDITTPAGTFKAYKITYDTEVTMGFIKSKGSATEWYTEKYGIIKSESYDKKGKLVSSEQLTKIINE